MNRLMVDLILGLLAVLCIVNAFLLFLTVFSFSPNEPFLMYLSFGLGVFLIGVDVFLAFGLFFLWERARKAAIVLAPIPLIALAVQLLVGSLGGGALLSLEFAGASFEPLSLLILPLLESLDNLSRPPLWSTIIDVVWTVLALVNLVALFFLRNDQVKELFQRRKNQPVRIQDPNQ